MTCIKLIFDLDKEAAATRKSMTKHLFTERRTETCNVFLKTFGITMILIANVIAFTLLLT